jgi:hypothetical protein
VTNKKRRKGAAGKRINESVPLPLFCFSSFLLFASIMEDLQLRPSPPPEAPPDSPLPWWPFVILAFLAMIVIFVRIRGRRIMLTPEKRLEQAIDHAGQSTDDISVRYLQLQKELRLYLSIRGEPRWHSLTSVQLQKEWEQLFPRGEQAHAQRLLEAWKNAEFIAFGCGGIEKKSLDQLIDLSRSLLVGWPAKTAQLQQEKRAGRNKEMAKDI